VSDIIFNPTSEQKQAELIQQAQRSQWLEENKKALDEYNRRIETRGTFSDGLRRF
jgi:antitoxin CcdA